MAGMSAIIGIFGGLMILLFSLLVLKPAQKELVLLFSSKRKCCAVKFAGEIRIKTLCLRSKRNRRKNTLSPTGNWKAADTGELVHPNSVTEGTTKLLSKDE